MKQIKYKSLLFLILFSPLALAQEVQKKSPLQQRVLPEKDSVVTAQEPFIRLVMENKQEMAYSQRELEEHPQFTAKLLNFAIRRNNPVLIKKVLHLYQDLPEADNILIDYAKGKLASLQGDYTTAIGYFKSILAKKPDMTPIRIELAIALFYDRQDTNAQKQFRKAQSAKDLPKEFNPIIEQYLAGIEQRNEWNFDVSFNYTQDKNINNVSDSRMVGNWRKPDSHLPQTAHGIEYSLGASKDFNVSGKHYIGFENYLSGATYWDNHRFDDLTNRTGLGYRYKSLKSNVSIMPFYKKNWNHDSDYNNWSAGVRVNASHWVSPRVNLATTGEYSKNHYPHDSDFNGNNKLLSGTLFFRRNPKQSFYFGVDTQSRRTNVKRFDSNAYSLRSGWIQEWDKGISSRLGLAYSHTRYGDKAIYGGAIPLGKVREDDSFSANLSLWKRDWSVWGITPKLYLSWRKQDSNIPSLYSYTKKDVNVIFEKSF